jgi:hypothetical protein
MKSPTSCAGATVAAAAQFVGTATPSWRWKAMPSSGLTGAFLAGVLPVVLRRDAHHDAGVGVALVARVLAHAVGDHAPGSDVAATTVPPGHMQKL